MTRFAFVALLATLAAGCCWFGETTGRNASPAADASAVSADGRNEIRLWTDPLAYEVVRDGVTVVAKTPIGMKIDGEPLARGQKIPTVVTKNISGAVPAPVYKKAFVDLARQEVLVGFGDWAIRLAARNDGVAYRFETMRKGRVTVNCEKAPLTIPSADVVCRVNTSDRFGCEETLNRTIPAGKIKTDPNGQKLVYLPLVYTVGEKTVAVTESDVHDYPIWNLAQERKCRAAGAVELTPSFAGWPKKTQHQSEGAGGNWRARTDLEKGGRWVKILEHTDYLVETEGTRTFPWRTFVLADAPAKLCEADIVWALARPAEAGADFSWVKPGKVAWDWWNAFDNQGAAGCNTRNYQRFIDFAAEHGVEYVIFDEGWSEQLDIWKFSDNVDVPNLIRYANGKGVGIILWMAWAQVVGEEEKVAAHFGELGAKGFKVDFMDRGDAEVERFLWKFADACARRKLVVDYHGAHRPTGMQRAYPNVLNFEGVCGLERMKWFNNSHDFMENDLKVAFCRMTAGPMDYTPGAMENQPIGRYVMNPLHPGSVGTRCHQMAQMALYEAPLQMLSDSPTNYEKNLECFKFMAATPVTWDDTVGLGGTPETHLALARRKGSAWYAAGLTNAEARDYDLDTGFLGSGIWRAEIFRDRVECDAEPQLFLHEFKTVRAGETLRIHLAPGGGFIVRFVK